MRAGETGPEPTEPTAPTAPASHETPRAFSSSSTGTALRPRGWLRALAACACLKVALAPVAFALGGSTGGGLPPALYLAHVVIWSGVGALLLLANRADRRAVVLGIQFLLLAATFSDPLIRNAAASAAGWPAAAAALVSALAIDAFLPATTWMFARDFPTLARERGDRLARVALRACLAIGTALFLVNVAFGLAAPRGAGLGETGSFLYALLARDSGAIDWAEDALGGYWAASFALPLPAYPFMFWKSRFARREERQRVLRFLLGLAVGTIPVLLTFLLAEMIPPLGRLLEDPGARGAVVWISHALLLSIPFTTSYAVLVDRTLDVRLVVRRALRYALARYTLLALCLVPLVSLVVFLYERRNATVAQLFSTPPLLLLLGLAVFAGAALASRRRWLDWLDRRFFREQYDARQILAELVDSARGAQDSQALSRLVEREADRALHLESVALYTLDPLARRFTCPGRELRSLDGASALARLLQASSEPLDVDLEEPRSVLRGLPEAERHWLADAAVRLLVPLSGSEGQLVGFVALGEKKSEQPFLREDRLLLKAVAGAVALPVENRLARESPSPALAGASATDDRPARDCLSCGAVQDPERESCETCGRRLVPSALPRVLLGKFRLERRIGAGGMGVVYKAQDLGLERTVAIKTLPKMAPEYASRLRREARAAAAVLHPNLALIFGAETWQGTPALVFEYLSGGTLARRLHDGKLEVRDVLELGIAVSAALERAHAVRILHRDVKPSNIGYAGDGTPKLLDFGLAHIVEDWRAEHAPPEPIPAPAGGELADGAAVLQVLTTGRLTRTGVIMGTPAYLAPEATAGTAPRPSFDLWATALVLYEALVGRNPLIGTSVAETMDRIKRAAVPDARELRPDCPEPLADLLRRALHLEPAKRPGSAAELKRALEGLRARLAA